MINLLRVAKALKAQGILGINRRNAEFIMHYNPRKFYPLVDDKLTSKQLALQAGLSVPQLYHVVESEHEIKALSQALASFKSFVVKPAHGSGGDGIMIVNGRRGQNYLLSDGTIISPDDFNFHVSNILSGMFSLGGHPDKAIFEAKVIFDPIFNDVTYQGVPDIRIIVFQGYPVMAMVRLPTRASDGKANLHQGAVGVGVDLHTGQTGFGVQHNRRIDVHPDTAVPIAGVTIPHWHNLLTLAAGCYELTHMGYLGVDIVLDAHLGPLILEFNARPGLSIQIANQRGLLPRLERVQSLESLSKNPLERVEFILKEA